MPVGTVASVSRGLSTTRTIPQAQTVSVSRGLSTTRVATQTQAAFVSRSKVQPLSTAATAVATLRRAIFWSRLISVVTSIVKIVQANKPLGVSITTISSITRGNVLLKILGGVAHAGAGGSGPTTNPLTLTASSAAGATLQAIIVKIQQFVASSSSSPVVQKQTSRPFRVGSMMALPPTFTGAGQNAVLIAFKTVPNFLTLAMTEPYSASVRMSSSRSLSTDAVGQNAFVNKRPAHTFAVTVANALASVTAVKATFTKILTTTAVSTTATFIREVRLSLEIVVAAVATWASFMTTRLTTSAQTTSTQVKRDLLKNFSLVEPALIAMTRARSYGLNTTAPTLALILNTRLKSLSTTVSQLPVALKTMTRSFVATVGQSATMEKGNKFKTLIATQTQGATLRTAPFKVLSAVSLTVATVSTGAAQRLVTLATSNAANAFMSTKQSTVRVATQAAAAVLRFQLPKNLSAAAGASATFSRIRVATLSAAQPSVVSLRLLANKTLKRTVVAIARMFTDHPQLFDKSRVGDIARSIRGVVRRRDQ